MESLTIPKDVTSIGNAIFNGCTGLKEIRFEGPAPILNGSIFVGVTATAYYPGDDSSWTREVRESCGGNITWVPTPNPFTDVKASKYYYMPVLWAYYHDPRITGGTGDGTTFSPNETCTRAQIVTFLWKAAGAPEPVNTQNSFTDVKPKHYFYKAVLWAVENGITSGTSPTTFGPNVPCTRAEVVTFIWSFADRPEPKTTDNPFKDVSSGKYYYKAVLWAYENEITGGVSANTFGPKVVCTRGQIVTFLYKYMEG